MHLEALVEEPSAEAALSILLPKLLPPGATHAIHAHQGKPDLMGKLTGRLQGYAPWLPIDWYILVLVDRDGENCRRLKERLDIAARSAGLIPFSAAKIRPRVHVINRIAIEELEAWFFGDLDAVRAAYPGVPSTLEHRIGYRSPDAVRGGTWEALERVLQAAGHHAGGLRKIEAARSISAHMVPGRNRSRSFVKLRDALDHFASR